MITINFTGLNRVYWLPNIHHESDHDGLWYVAIRWLGIEVFFYSVEMGIELVHRINGEH